MRCSSSLALVLSSVAPAAAQVGGCPTVPEVAPYGDGSPGSAGIPYLAASGAPIPGHVFELRVSCGAANAPGLLFYSLAPGTVPLPLFGATLHLAAPLVLQPFTLDADGAVEELALLAPVAPSYCGARFFLQAVVIDAAAVGSVAFTRGIEVAIGAESAVTTFHRWQYPIGYSGEGLASGDLNGDGHTDLAVSDDSVEGVSILLGTGTGEFTHAPAPTLGGETNGIALADVDGDSALDLFVTDRTADVLSILLGVGDGTFGAASQLAVASRPRSILVEDLDGDGELDLAVGHELGGLVKLFSGVGDGTFSPWTELVASGPVRTVVAGDLDGDGSTDLVVQTEASVASVFLGTASGFVPGPAPLLGGGNDIVLGDWNADGDLDIAAYGWNDFDVLVGNGDGSFGPPTELQTVGSGGGAVAAGDWDGNGTVDLALSTNGLEVFAGNGDGTFGPALYTQYGGNGSRVVVEDFDGDGAQDLALSGLATVQVLRGTGSGAFETGVPDLPSAGSPSGVAVADLDGDGAQDLVYTSWDDQTFEVRLGLGDGTFGPATAFPTVQAPGDVLLRDVDVDGLLDAVVLNASSLDQFFGVHRGTGTGAFEPPTQLTTFSAADAVVGDLDGDGLPDLVVASWFHSVVVVHLGVGGGDFATIGSTPAGLRPLSVDGGDLNGDGTLDIVASDNLKDFVAVLFGNGDGTFAAPVNVSISEGGEPGGHVLLHDWNDDGELDLTVSRLDGVVRIRPGVGDGTFGAPNEVVVDPYNSFELAVGDLDADGADDLAVLTSTGRWATVFGNGDGTLGGVVEYLAGWDFDALAVGDLDGNGTLDVVLTDRPRDWLVLQFNQLVP